MPSWPRSQLIDVAMGLRLSKEDETMGADIVEHGAYLQYGDISLSAESLATVVTEQTPAEGLEVPMEDMKRHHFRQKAQDMFRELLSSCHRCVIRF